MTTKYRTPLPDGRIATRTSATRRYTHIVVTFADYPASVGEWELKHHSGRWLVAGYCGSLPLAEKLAGTWSKTLTAMGCSNIDVRILPVGVAS